MFLGTVPIGADGVVVSQDSTASITGPAEKILRQTMFANYSANAVWDGQSEIKLQDDAELFLAAGSGAAFAVQAAGITGNSVISGSNTCKVEVSPGGTLDVSTSGTFVIKNAQTLNFGDINVNKGTMGTYSIQNSGTTTVAASQSLGLGIDNTSILFDSTVPDAAGSTITGTGTTQFLAGSTVTVELNRSAVAPELISSLPS